MLEKASAAFKLNTAQSSKYKLDIIIVHVLLHLFVGILFNLMSNKHDAQDCHLLHDIGSKMENI